jgi:hypothetical protein
MSTFPKRKRTAEETLAALERQAAEDEMDRILALSDADLDAELSQAGLDPKAERARGGPMGREAHRAAARLVEHGVHDGDATAWTRAEPRATPVVRPRFARRVFALAAAAAVAGGIVVGVRWMTSRTEVAVPSPPADAAPADAAPAPTPAPPASAEDLRRQAADACDQYLWARCRNLLDTAAARDPDGEATAAVQALRRKIQDGLGLGDAARRSDKPSR